MVRECHDRSVNLIKCNPTGKTSEKLGFLVRTVVRSVFGFFLACVRPPAASPDQEAT